MWGLFLDVLAGDVRFCVAGVRVSCGVACAGGRRSCGVCVWTCLRAMCVSVLQALAFHAASRLQVVAVHVGFAFGRACGRCAFLCCRRSRFMRRRVCRWSPFMWGLRLDVLAGDVRFCFTGARVSCGVAFAGGRRSCGVCVWTCLRAMCVSVLQALAFHAASRLQVVAVHVGFASGRACGRCAFLFCRRSRFMRRRVCRWSPFMWGLRLDVLAGDVCFCFAGARVSCGVAFAGGRRSCGVCVWASLRAMCVSGLQALAFQAASRL